MCCMQTLVAQNSSAGSSGHGTNEATADVETRALAYGNFGCSAHGNHTCVHIARKT